jgi:hypothetical protein
MRKESINLSEYSVAMSSWETLYLLVGTAATTLMGLLFVAISIHVENFYQQDRLDLRNFGALTFNSFFYVLLIAVLFLAPGLGWSGLGILLLLLAIVDLVNASLQHSRARRAQILLGNQAIASRFWFPIVSLLGLVVISILVILHVPGSLYGVLVVVICLLGSASINAWSLLVQVDQQEAPQSESIGMKD